MAQACEASRLSLHAPVTAVATASASVGTPETAKCTCAHDEIIAALAWQAKNACDGRVKRGVDSFRKDDNTRTSATRTSHPQRNVLSPAEREPSPQYASSENANCTHAEQAKNSAKPRAITCFKCGKSGHVASTCNPRANPTPAVALATWRVTMRFALLKRRRKRAFRLRMPLPQQAKAPRKSLRPPRLQECLSLTRSSTLARRSRC